MSDGSGYSTGADTNSRVIEPPEPEEMLSDPRELDANLKMKSIRRSDSIPDPLDMPELGPMSVVPPPTPETKDIRPVWARKGPALTSAAEASITTKIGIPDGIYFLAGLMLIPFVLVSEAFFVSPKTTSAVFSASFTISTSSNFSINNLLPALTWITAIMLGIGAILLLIRRVKFAPVVAMIGLGFLALTLAIPTIQDISNMNKSVLKQSSSFGITSEYVVTAKRMQTVDLINSIVIMLLPFIGIIYLNKPSVKNAYGDPTITV